MEVKSYSVCPPVKGITKQWAVWLNYNKASTTPLIYLQRPKYIKDDAVWEKIVESVRLEINPEHLQGL